MTRIWVDGVADAGVPGDDLALTMGLGVFETLRSYGPRLFRLQAHLERLRASCSWMDIEVPPGLDEELRSRAGRDQQVRITLTASGRRVLRAAPVDPSRTGRPLRCARVVLEPAPSLPASVKHVDRAAWILAARRLGVDEVVLVDRQGHLLETNNSNLIAVVDGVLRAPADRALQGVTRAALIEVAEHRGIPVDTAPLPDRPDWEELYLCSTLKELAPVGELDGRPGPGWGRVGRALHEGFRELVARECGPELG